MLVIRHPMPIATQRKSFRQAYRGALTTPREGAVMATATRNASRTENLLALMTKGDDLFNARDWPALDEVHHLNMIAYVTGSAEPIYGRDAHDAAMQQLVRMFPDIRVHTPYPIQFGGGDWITVVTNVTGTFTGEMTQPDGAVIQPTGKAFDLEFAQTSKWDDDQLVVISAFWDAAQQAKQLGLAQ
jgi:SnoaL-like polyketide cyclase